MTNYEIGKIRAEARARGDKTYFTGLPCKHGHIAPRRLDCGNCTVCTTLMVLRGRKAKGWPSTKKKVYKAIVEYARPKCAPLSNAPMSWNEIVAYQKEQCRR